MADDGVDLMSQFLFSDHEMADTMEDLFIGGTTSKVPFSSAAVRMHDQPVLAAGSEDEWIKARRPAGNRAAARRYREKQKAHAAFLAEEVRKLRAENHQLRRRLQGHAALHSEVARLRSLLLDIRSKIGGALPNFQRHCSACSTDLCSNGS